ncbi:MAG: cobalamin-dependent protein, partial [Chloroflexi bacterium]|nr:cobalamin-dependent protein [Chloroflexota bacterium]
MSENGRLDLLLINPGGRVRIYQSLADTLSAIEPPVWAGLMATFTRKRGLSVQIIDADADNLGPDEVAARAADLNPVLTAVVAYGHQPSASTQSMPASSAICTSLKQTAPQLKTLLVGGHVTSLPKRTLEEEDVDFVCGGEGPYTLVELTEALKAGRPEDVSKVRGIWYRDGQQIRNTPPAPLVQDLDNEMPGLAWDLLPMDKYRAHNWHCFGDLQRQPYAAVYTTLGCPYHCSFCCIQAPFKEGSKVLGLGESVNAYRLWSPDAVMAQIATLVEDYGVKNIKIADEMFVLNPRHVNSICDQIIERGYDLNIWAYARVDTVRAGMADKLKRAGFNWLAFGIEAADQVVRNDVDKGFDQDLIFKTINEVKAADINIGANYIFGLPEDDLASMRKTLDLAIELNTEWANFYCTMAYPGSPLYNTAVKEAMPLPATWSGYSQHAVDTLPLPTKHLTASQVLRFRDEAFQTYFTSPRFLDMVTEKF